MKTILMLVLTLAFPAMGNASCWEEAGARHGVETALLKAIGWKESRGWTNAVGPKLKDGNRALGVMQINTIHLPVLAKYGIKKKDLFDACVSQEAGAWILSDCVGRFGKTWNAVGCYYGGPGFKKLKQSVIVEYVLDVQKFYEGYKRQEQLVAANQVQTAMVGETGE